MVTNEGLMLGWHCTDGDLFTLVAQEAIFSKTIGCGYQLYCWPQEAIDIGLGKISIFQEVGKEV